MIEFPPPSSWFCFFYFCVFSYFFSWVQMEVDFHLLFLFVNFYQVLSSIYKTQLRTFLLMKRFSWRCDDYCRRWTFVGTPYIPIFFHNRLKFPSYERSCQDLFAWFSLTKYRSETLTLLWAFQAVNLSYLAFSQSLPFKFSFFTSCRH